jgi:hypothetical protein
MKDFYSLNNQQFRRKNISFNLKQELQEVYEIGKYKANLSNTEFHFNMNFIQETKKSQDFAKMI